MVGDLTEQDCRDFAAAARAKVPIPGDDRWDVDGWVKEELLQQPAKLRDVLTHAKLDPCDHVRGVASQLEVTLKPGAGQ